MIKTFMLLLIAICSSACGKKLTCKEAKDLVKKTETETMVAWSGAIKSKNKKAAEETRDKLNNDCTEINTTSETCEIEFPLIGKHDVSKVKLDCADFLKKMNEAISKI